MRKIALSVLTIAALAIAVTGGTFAIFSDSDSVLGNTVTTARISIDAREVVNKPLAVTGLLPGYSGDPGTVDLYNDGNAPQYQYMYIENLQGALCDELMLKLGYSYVNPNVFDVVYGDYDLNNLVGETNKIKVDRYNPNPANWTTRLVQQASLPSTVSDPSLMAATCTWDEVFVGVQVVPAQ